MTIGDMATLVAKPTTQVQTNGHHAKTRTGIIDCDVHVFPKDLEEVRAFMSMPFSERLKGGGRGFFGNPVHGNRMDAKPASGLPTGADPDFLREQLIDLFAGRIYDVTPESHPAILELRALAEKARNSGVLWGEDRRGSGFLAASA